MILAKLEIGERGEFAVATLDHTPSGLYVVLVVVDAEGDAERSFESFKDAARAFEHFATVAAGLCADAGEGLS